MNKQVLIVSKAINETIQSWMNKNKHYDITVAHSDEAAVDHIFRMEFDRVIVNSDDEAVNMKKLTALLNMQQPDAVVLQYAGENLDGLTAKLKEAVAIKRGETSRVVISDTLSPQNLANMISVYPILN